MLYVRIIDPTSLARLKTQTTRGVAPWLQLYHPTTAFVAQKTPEQNFFRSWCDAADYLALAEAIGGERIVVCAHVGPLWWLKGDEPIWDHKHYADIYAHACRWRDRLKRTWDKVWIGVDTEFRGAMDGPDFRENFPPGWIKDLPRFDLYKTLYTREQDLKHPHTWWQYLLGPSDPAMQVVGRYHKDWSCEPGHCEQWYCGPDYGWNKGLDEFLNAAKVNGNVLMSAPRELDGALCQRIAERG